MKVSAGTIRRYLERIPARRLVATMTLALACCPFLAGQTLAPIGHTPVAASETTPPSGSSLVLPDYIISPDDVLNINVYEAPDVTGDYRVSPAGQIVLPLLNAPIVAAGRTPGELADLISASPSALRNHASMRSPLPEP